jgi:hypothetical protein
MPSPRLSRVNALLASSPRKPQGDTRCGMEILLCLTSDGQPDLLACGMGEPWRVRRFWNDRPDWHGLLVAHNDQSWAIRDAADPDGPLWELKVGTFRPGEYVTLRRPDRSELSFRIVSVEAV